MANIYRISMKHKLLHKTFISQNNELTHIN